MSAFSRSLYLRNKIRLRKYQTKAGVPNEMRQTTLRLPTDKNLMRRRLVRGYESIPADRNALAAPSTCGARQSQSRVARSGGMRRETRERERNPPRFRMADREK